MTFLSVNSLLLETVPALHMLQTFVCYVIKGKGLTQITFSLVSECSHVIRNIVAIVIPIVTVIILIFFFGDKNSLCSKGSPSAHDSPGSASQGVHTMGVIEWIFKSPEGLGHQH